MMDFNRTGPTSYGTFFFTQVPANKMELLHLTYIRGLILELSRSFPIAFNMFKRPYWRIQQD